MKETSLCDVYNVEDSPDHIITSCSTSGQKQVWDLVKTIWERKYRRLDKQTYVKALENPR
jgi:hypothetical protein